MASIIQSILSVFTENSDGHSVLPTSIHDSQEIDLEQGGLLAGDLLQDNFYSEADLVETAYAGAMNNTFRESNIVYYSDFYKEMNQRIPSEITGQHPQECVWRVDIDHPVAQLLTIHQIAQPIHHIKDIYGDQLIYTNCDINTGIAMLIELCGKYNFEVLPDPDLVETEIGDEVKEI